MTTDYNVNLIVSGGVQDAMNANAAVQGGGDAGAQSLPVLQAQKLATQQIQKEITARIPPLDRFFKGMGIEVSIKSLLKQSQIFTSTIGALFQMFGAMIDMMLAPFTKYIVLLIEKFAEWIPKMGQVAIWAEKYIFGPIVTAIKAIHNFLNDPPKALANLAQKMGAPDWLVNMLGGGGEDGDGDGGGGGFLGGWLGDAFIAALGGAAVGAAFSKTIRRALTNLFMATIDVGGKHIPGLRNLTKWRSVDPMTALTKRVNTLTDTIADFVKRGQEVPTAVRTALATAQDSLRATTVGIEGGELGAGVSKLVRPTGLRLIKKPGIVDEADGILRTLRNNITSKFGEVWPAVRPHLDSLVDGVRSAFSVFSGRSIPAIILTGIGAIAIGAYAIFNGAANEIAKSVAPISRAASRVVNRYGPGGGRGTPAGEGLMTPIEDISTTRPPSTSFWGRSVSRFKSAANWRPFQGGGDALNEMVPGRVQTGTPYSMNTAGDAASAAKVGSRSFLRSILPLVASVFAIWQGADQMNRDRQTDIFKEMPMFRHSTPGDNPGKQFMDELTGWTASSMGMPGMGKLQTGETTQYDLMMSSMQGMVVGAITGLFGFGIGTAGQAYQESRQIINNQATGQAWDTGTLLAPLLDLANWAGVTSYNPVASTTNVTVNFADGRKENINFDANEATHEIQTDKGSVFVEQTTVTSTTRALAASSGSDYGVGVFD